MEGQPDARRDPSAKARTAVYSAFGTQVFELVREASWQRDEVGRGDAWLTSRSSTPTSTSGTSRSSGLQWAWLEPGFSFRKWTFDAAIDAPRYGPDGVPCRGGTAAGWSGAVHVHCADPLPNPADETAWIDSLAVATGWPQAQVGRCDLDAPDAAATIVAEAVSPLFRGVRDPFSAKRLDADVRGTGDGRARRGRRVARGAPPPRRLRGRRRARQRVGQPCRSCSATAASRSSARPTSSRPGVRRCDRWRSGRTSPARSRRSSARRSPSRASTSCARGCSPASRRSAPTAAWSRRTSRSTVRTARTPSWSTLYRQSLAELTASPSGRRSCRARRSACTDSTCPARCESP